MKPQLFLAGLGGCLAGIAFAGAAGAAPLPVSDAKSRLFVLTDIANEPDDEGSLVRLLVHANEYDLEGIVVTTSLWLRRGPREDLVRRQIDPDLFYIVSPSPLNHREYHRGTWSGISGDRRYRNGPMHRFELVDNPWLERNVIKGHGPLGALYPPFKFIMEGDTPSFLGLVRNGLAWDERPDYGGWAGRYAFYQCTGEVRKIWTNNEDSRDTVRAADGHLYTSDQATIWRWREAYQDEFAVRMDWCVRPHGAANHHPHAVVNGSAGRAVLRLKGRPCDQVTLDAAGSGDPDGDAIDFLWFHYPEAGGNLPVLPEIAFANPRASRVTFPLPAVKRTHFAHFILEVCDGGAPPLRAYRRIIVEVEP
jgi:hypothetical protein